MQWPASCSLLAAIVLLTWGRSPYRTSLGVWLDQWMLRALRSILVYVPSSECFMASVSAQASHPYKRMDSTVPLKKRTFSSLLKLDFQIRDMLLRAFQAKDFRTAMSLSVYSTHDPRYLKSSTHSSSVPSKVCSGGGSSILIGRPLVFLAFMPRPTI